MSVVVCPSQFVFDCSHSAGHEDVCSSFDQACAVQHHLVGHFRSCHPSLERILGRADGVGIAAARDSK